MADALVSSASAADRRARRRRGILNRSEDRIAKLKLASNPDADEADDTPKMPTTLKKLDKSFEEAFESIPIATKPSGESGQPTPQPAAAAETSSTPAVTAEPRQKKAQTLANASFIALIICIAGIAALDYLPTWYTAIPVYLVVSMILEFDKLKTSPLPSGAAAFVVMAHPYLGLLHRYFCFASIVAGVMAFMVSVAIGVQLLACLV